jgi:hypothetical protein
MDKIEIAFENIEKRLKEIEHRLTGIEQNDRCTCIGMIDHAIDVLPQRAWFCPKHGRQLT